MALRVFIEIFFLWARKFSNVQNETGLAWFNTIHRTKLFYIKTVQLLQQAQQTKTLYFCQSSVLGRVYLMSGDVRLTTKKPTKE